MKRFLTAILLFELFSCNLHDAHQNVQQLDFGPFTIETPRTWQMVKSRSIDSYAGRIAIDETDTLHFDLGLYSDDLTEYMELIMEDGKTYYISSYDTGYYPILFESSNKYKVIKSNITWEIIDESRAKVLTPIKAGIGTTGIFIDSLRINTTSFHKFNFYGSNLKPQNEILTLAAFRTIKFKN